MTHFLRYSILCILLAAFSPLIAQYRLDTTLSYSDFLRQCSEFSKRTTAQEVWVVHFWSSSNAPSLSLISSLRDMQRRYVGKPIRFIGISIDKNRDDWAKRLTQTDMPWEQVLVSRENDYAFLKRAFKHSSIPALFVVDPSAKIHLMGDIRALEDALVTESGLLPNRAYQKANDAPKPMPAGQQRPSGSDQWIQHTVRPGETLYGLARQYGVSVESIKSANSLGEMPVRTGETIRIKRK